MQSSGSKGRRYTAEELTAVFADVVRQLNDKGYQLKAPTLALIRTFLGESTETEGERGAESS